MAWTTIPGTGNLLMASTDAIAAGIGSFQNVSMSSLMFTSSMTSVLSASTATSSAIALPARPQGYWSVNYAGTTVKLPYFRT